MKLFDIDKKLEKEYNDYLKNIEDYANEIFETRIKSWLDKYHLNFYSGNGTFLIKSTEKTPEWFVNKHFMSYGHGAIDNQKIDKRISRILYSTVTTAYNGDCLACFMSNYEQL